MPHLNYYRGPMWRLARQEFYLYQFFKQTFAIYLLLFFSWMDFSFQLFPFPSEQFSRPLSGITVDDNLASVFIFLSSKDNDRGAKAAQKLWEEEQRPMGEERKKKRIQLLLPSAVSSAEGKPSDWSTQRGSVDLNSNYFLTVITVWKLVACNIWS